MDRLRDISPISLFGIAVISLYAGTQVPGWWLSVTCFTATSCTLILAAVRLLNQSPGNRPPDAP